MEYPEEIYWDNFVPGISLTRQKTFLVERAYDMGYRAGKADQSDPLEGYSNLTAAISAGEPIDWERLDGLKVQCVKPALTTFKGKLERNEPRPADYPAGWWRKDADSLYISAFIYGWAGRYGWTLWVEGEIPMRRKTADQLPLGMCFEGEYHGSRIELAQVIANRYGNRLVTDHAEKNIGGYGEEEVEVIEEYGIGTFQKPEGK